MQKGKIVVWGGLTNSWEEKRRKDKAEKERYIQLNAEFKRRARRDKKAIQSDQCKEIEENSRMGKTRDLVKKVRHMKGEWTPWNIMGTWNIGTIKHRNTMDLTETEIFRGGGKNTQKNYTIKALTNQIMMVVWSFTLSQTSWNEKSRGLRKHHYEQS